MPLSERTKNGLDHWVTDKRPEDNKSWADRIKDWFAAVIGWGLEIILDVLGRAAAPKLAPLIQTLESAGDIPPELEPFLKEMKNPTGEVAAFFAQSAGGAVIGGAIGSILDALFMRFAYTVNSKFHPIIANEAQLVSFWLRGMYTDEELTRELRKLGADDSKIAILKELSQLRLNPETVSKIWLRNKEQYEYLWKQITDSGVPPAMVSVFKELAHVLPTPQEITLWAAREVFEPDMVERYGLDDEFDRLDLSLYEKVGIREDMAKNHWRAHWQHPALGTVFDLLHRGEITNEEMFEYYRLVEIPPHWRDKLTNISWDLPNRIELRMMARYGLVDKDFLVEQLKKVGLAEEYRSIAADMMLAMGIRTDLSTRFSKGWLDAEGVKSELAASGLSPEVQDRMYMWIVKNTGTDRVEKERDLTKAEIYKAIKKGALSPAQGIELISDMGYSDEEAQLLVEINVGALEGSPETYQELKRLTQLYRQSQGLEAKVPPTELVQAERDVLEAERALKDIQAKVREDMTEAEARASLERAKQQYLKIKETTGL